MQIKLLNRTRRNNSTISQRIKAPRIALNQNGKEKPRTTVPENLQRIIRETINQSTDRWNRTYHFFRSSFTFLSNGPGLAVREE
jgi:hypothetical protein